MPIRGNAYSAFRNVIISYTADEAMPIDAYKAVLGFVETNESKYSRDTNSVGDLTNVATPLTGTSRFDLHVFNVTVDISAATYTFDYVETVPNADSIS
jgi:hypothetical protein